MKYHEVLPVIDTFEVWRSAARWYAQAGVPWEDITWHYKTRAQDLFGGGSAVPPSEHRRITVSKPFLSLAQSAIQHSDPERFALLYKVLLRLQSDPHLTAERTDRDIKRLRDMEKAVRRDAHKMHAFVRFKEVPSTGRRKFAAWFEPDHHITQANASFFAKRFGDMDWEIATPDLMIRFIDGRISLHEDIPPSETPVDATEDLWRTYYANIFNPARLKVSAMCSEMPKKYWHNLPEADLIPELIQSAERKTKEMRDRQASQPNPLAKKLAARGHVNAKPRDT